MTTRKASEYERHLPPPRTPTMVGSGCLCHRVAHRGILLQRNRRRQAAGPAGGIVGLGVYYRADLNQEKPEAYFVLRQLSGSIRSIDRSLCSPKAIRSKRSPAEARGLAVAFEKGCLGAWEYCRTNGARSARLGRRTRMNRQNGPESSTLRSEGRGSARYPPERLVWLAIGSAVTVKPDIRRRCDVEFQGGDARRHDRGVRQPGPSGEKAGVSVPNPACRAMKGWTWNR
jgi:hypothetical protein